MFTISKFSVPRTLLEAVRQASSKAGGKGGGDKGKGSSISKENEKCGPPKKSGSCEPKKNAKGAKKGTAKIDTKNGGKIEKCGGVPPTVPPAASDGKAPVGSLGGVGRESSCKLKVKQSAKGGSRAGAFKKLCLYGIIPALVVFNMLILSTRTDEERPEFKKWPHLYKRDKPFPWRDGVKSLFHNSHTNALPESGYEDE